MIIGNAALHIVETLLVNGHPTTSIVTHILTERVVGHAVEFLERSLATSFARLVNASQNKFVLAERVAVHPVLKAQLTVNRQFYVVKTVFVGSVVHVVERLNRKGDIAPRLNGIGEHAILQFETFGSLPGKERSCAITWIDGYSSGLWHAGIPHQLFVIGQRIIQAGTG